MQGCKKMDYYICFYPFVTKTHCLFVPKSERAQNGARIQIRGKARGSHGETAKRPWAGRFEPTKVLEEEMNAMELAHLQIEDLVPHRDRMLLIGEVLEVNTIQARTVSSVNANWPLTGPEGAEPLICVELAAQTAGVCNGWDRIKNRGLDSEQMGWLVAVKRAEFFCRFSPSWQQH